jgi:hypothetical protein
LNNPAREVRHTAAQARQQRLAVIRVAAETLLTRRIPGDLLPQILMQIYDPDDVWTVLAEYGIVP